jgi:hypothetical protein
MGHYVAALIDRMLDHGSNLLEFLPISGAPKDGSFFISVPGFQLAYGGKNYVGIIGCELS